MSLTVYLSRDEVPDNMVVINNNDAYFDGMTVLKDVDFVHKVLKEIEKAERHSTVTFIGRTASLGALNKSCLSTGTKTLLNIYSHPFKCFNVVECGNNALEFLCDIHVGNILWEEPVFFIERENEGCDILCRNLHFNNICDFVDYGWEDNFNG